MKKLNSYILKQIFVGFALVTFSLMAILWLTQSLRFVQLVTNKGLPLGLFIEMTSLLMPRLFALLSPIAMFSASLFVYNRMLSDRELVVMKSAGISPWKNALPATYFGIIMSFFGIYMVNLGIPQAEAAFSELEWQVKNDVSHLMFKEGQFTQVQYGLTVFITEHEKDGSMSGILLNDERNPASKTTITSEKGRVVYTEKGPRIILVNGIRQEINPGTKQFSSLAFDRYSVDFGGNNYQQEKEEGVREKNLFELLNARSDKTLTEKQADRYIVEGHKRLVNPFYNLLFVLLGCVGLIVGNFNRRGQSKIISLSILAMVIVQSLELVFENLAAKHISLLFLLYANLLLPLGICIYLLLFYNPAFLRRRKTAGELLYEQ
ncbi:MAG: LPS export ABC transporter permease LptF [Pseudomonadota bacterium]|nr:LPS export ABC transporter permease LptF [Pseudomonadota bacterium]